MSALIQWLTATFGPLGGALVFIVLVILLAEIARYAFWTIALVVVAWYVGVNTDALRRDNRRDERSLLSWLFGAATTSDPPDDPRHTEKETNGKQPTPAMQTLLDPADIEQKFFNIPTEVGYQLAGWERGALRALVGPGGTILTDWYTEITVVEPGTAIVREGINDTTVHWQPDLRALDAWERDPQTATISGYVPDEQTEDHQ